MKDKGFLTFWIIWLVCAGQAPYRHHTSDYANLFSSLQVYIFRYRLPTTHNVVCSPIIVCFCDNLYSHNKVKSAFISSRLQPSFGAMAFSGKSGKTMVFSVEQFKRVVLGDVCLLTGIQMEGICIDLENCAVDTRRTCGRGQRPCMPAAA